MICCQKFQMLPPPDANAGVETSGAVTMAVSMSLRSVDDFIPVLPWLPEGR